MVSPRWRILLIEDDEDDYILTRDLLSEVKPGQFELEWVSTFDEALDLCRRQIHDVYLVDYRLGARDGLSLVKEALAEGCQAPFIVMTGQGSYAVDVEAMKAGATDYLSKGEITPALLERTIRYALERKQAERALSEANTALQQARDELEMRVQARTEELHQTNQRLAAANQELMAEITERKRAQEALSESEARFRKLAETTSSAIFIVQDFKISYANPAAKLITGYSQEELASMHFWELAHPAYQDVLKQRGVANQWSNPWADQLASQIPTRYELKLLTKNKQERWVDITAGQIDYDGKPALVVTAFDITERDLAEQALSEANAALRQAKAELEERVAERTAELREANERLEFELQERRRAAEERERLLAQIANEQARLKTIIANAPEGIIVTDPDCRIVLTNPAAERIFASPIPIGKPVSSADGIKFYHASGEIYYPEDLPLIRSARMGETHSNIEMSVLWPDGQRRQLLMNTTPILDQEGEVSGAIAIFQDITSRKLEEEERRNNLARIEVQKRLMEHREKERLMIAQELHDGPLQELIGITFMLNSALDQVQDTDLHLKLLNVQSAIQKQIRELRAFSSELRPPTLTPFGLEKAIRSHVESVQRKNPDLNFILNLYNDGKQLPEDVRLALFRIYQEALNNVLRHANARNVEVQFEIENGTAWLEVRDDGEGFDLPEDWIETARAGHFGLVGARERTEAVGGQISIQSRAGEGTRLRVSVPIRPN